LVFFTDMFAKWHHHMLLKASTGSPNGVNTQGERRRILYAANLRLRHPIGRVL